MPAGIYSGSKKAKYQNEKNKDKQGMLTGGQAKIAAKAPPPNKIDEKDFAVLRAEKARGRGMGLQDEKVQPGKVMKARMGKRIRVKDDDSFDTKMKLQEKGVIDKKTGAGRERITKAMKATSLGRKLLLPVAAGVAASQYLKSKMKKKKESKDTFIDGSKVAASKLSPRMAGGMMKKYSKGGGLDMGGPKGRLMAYAKENMIKDKDRLTLRDKAMIKTVKNMDKSEYPAAERYLKKLTSTKKMGGGMIAPSQRPGYSKGIMVKARGCKLGRTRPTKIT